MKIELPQQSLAILRSALSAPGWAETPAEIYTAGHLLCQVLPEPDLSWIQSDADLATLTPEGLAEYRSKDQEWCNESVTVELSERGREVVRTCLTKLAAKMPVNKYTYALLGAFGFSD